MRYICYDSKGVESSRGDLMMGMEDTEIPTHGYIAIFLDNGQVITFWSSEWAFVYLGTVPKLD